MKKLKIKTRKLGRERIDGNKIWGYFDTEKDLIEIDATLKGKSRLRILIHELLHAAFPDASEYQVKVAARLLSEYLWLDGFRKIK